MSKSTIKRKIWVIIFALLVIISTLFVKQHFIYDVIAALLFYSLVTLLLYVYILLEGSRELYAANKVVVNTVFGINIGIPFIILICFHSRKITYNIDSNSIIYQYFGLKKTISLSQIVDIKRTPSTDSICVYYLKSIEKKRMRIYYPNSQIQLLLKEWNSTCHC